MVGWWGLGVANIFSGSLMKFYLEPIQGGCIDNWSILIDDFQDDIRSILPPKFGDCLDRG